MLICLGAPLITVKNRIVNAVFMDARALFNWSYRNFKSVSIIKAKQVYTKIPVTQGEGETEVTLCFKTGVNKLVYGKYDSKKLFIKPINMPKTLSAPIKEGQTICNVQIYYNGLYVKTVPLIANKSIKKLITESDK